MMPQSMSVSSSAGPASGSAGGQTYSTGGLSFSKGIESEHAIIGGVLLVALVLILTMRRK